MQFFRILIALAFTLNAYPAVSSENLDTLISFMLEYENGEAVRELETKVANGILNSDSSVVYDLYLPLRQRHELTAAALQSLSDSEMVKLGKKIGEHNRECVMAGTALLSLTRVLAEREFVPVVRDGIVMIDGTTLDESFNDYMVRCASTIGWSDYQPRIGRDGSCLVSSFTKRSLSPENRAKSYMAALEQCKQNPDFFLMHGLDEQKLPEPTKVSP